MSDKSELYSASDLAKKANVSPSYVARLCRTGELPALKMGTVWLIKAADAEAWLATRSEHTDKN
ncbi:MAG: helix-turn-helix domain-containing protein [Opitutaceae bacterium]